MGIKRKIHAVKSADGIMLLVAGGEAGRFHPASKVGAVYIIAGK